MKMILCIDNNGKYYILKKFYDDKLEENIFVDEYIYEDLNNSEHIRKEDYGKIFIANISIYKCNNYNPEYDDIHFEININLDKCIFDLNSI